jgi:hypothetical protein
MHESVGSRADIHRRARADVFQRNDRAKLKENQARPDSIKVINRL